MILKSRDVNDIEIQGMLCTSGWNAHKYTCIGKSHNVQYTLQICSVCECKCM